MKAGRLPPPDGKRDPSPGSFPPRARGAAIPDNGRRAATRAPPCRRRRAAPARQPTGHPDATRPARRRGRTARRPRRRARGRTADAAERSARCDAPRRKVPQAQAARAAAHRTLLANAGSPPGRRPASLLPGTRDRARQTPSAPPAPRSARARRRATRTAAEERRRERPGRESRGGASFRELYFYTVSGTLASAPGAPSGASFASPCSISPARLAAPRACPGRCRP